MDTNRMSEILERIREIKIAVYGDFCLDAYWTLDPRGSEVSVETGLQAQAASEQRYSLGGAGNVVANLAALRPAAIHAIGVIGNDIFGRELLRQLEAIGANTAGMVVQESGFDTMTYCKRYLDGEEQPRLDFGIFNKRSEKTDNALLYHLERALREVEVLILNQQVPGSITNPSFIAGLNELIARFPQKIVLLDSRHYADSFKNVYLKTNQVEAARLNKMKAGSHEVFRLAEIERFATRLFQVYGKPVFVSRGDRGLLAVDGEGSYEAPGIQILKKVDTVGAGDTTTSAIACCLAAGARLDEVVTIANLAAAVTVQKLFQTGTASAEEILQLGTSPDYVYQPELAEDIRQAAYLQDSEIEICCDSSALPTGHIKHAVFDHDGTISVLRQGWETVMGPVMMKAILGQSYQSADERLFRKVQQRVRDYIDKSTGIQTIVQMENLREMVDEFGVVPKDQILDKFGYKQIYNTALMELVNRRKAKLERGELEVSDYVIKGAVAFLTALRRRGVTLYLASGTDEADVIAEATAMGYAELFNGGIYGSVGDISKYSKKMVIEKIIRENNLQGEELATFGDGPVEIRECRRVNGIAVGIASDEIRRHGLNAEKRARLIKAGAHLIAPDFSQPQRLLAVLFD